MLRLFLLLLFFCISSINKLIRWHGQPANTDLNQFPLYLSIFWNHIHSFFGDKNFICLANILSHFASPIDSIAIHIDTVYFDQMIPSKGSQRKTFSSF